MEETIHATLTFDGNDPLYEDHFPGNPVVPGSLVVEALLTLLQEKGVTPLSVRNFRFRRFIEPGSYPCKVVLVGAKAACTLFHGESRAVTGEVVLS